MQKERFAGTGLLFNSQLDGKNLEEYITLSAEEREIGGLGIYMVKQSMDKVEYRYEDGCNILTIEKYLPEDGGEE